MIEDNFISLSRTLPNIVKCDSFLKNINEHKKIR